jgi:hypothetical protein
MLVSLVFLLILLVSLDGGFMMSQIAPPDYDERVISILKNDLYHYSPFLSRGKIL